MIITILFYCYIGGYRKWKRRGLKLEDCVTTTKKGYVEYSKKEGDNNGVPDIWWTIE